MDGGGLFAVSGLLPGLVGEAVKQSLPGLFDRRLECALGEAADEAQDKSRDTAGATELWSNNSSARRACKSARQPVCEAIRDHVLAEIWDGSLFHTLAKWRRWWRR
jgi:hypothetical protein